MDEVSQRSNSIYRTLMCLCIVLSLNFWTSNIAFGSEQQSSIDKQLDTERKNAEIKRIITLSPHLTEIVFDLGLGDQLVAVSDYSDFPEQAKELPSIASYQGANIAEILRLNPTHVIVWRGGNKDSDIERLHSLDINIYESSITNADELVEDISALGTFLDAKDSARKLTEELIKVVNKTKQIGNDSVSAIYVISQSPTVGLGNDEWLNQLLSLCNIKNVFADTVTAYPQLRIDEIIRQQPQWIINATGAGKQAFRASWKQHLEVMKSDIIQVNPDAMHRFSSRAVYENLSLCKHIHASEGN